jgi:hypothetical protein
VTARLAADGSIAAYRLRLGWLDCTLTADGRLGCRGCIATLRRNPGDAR